MHCYTHQQIKTSLDLAERQDDILETHESIGHYMGKFIILRARLVKCSLCNSCFDSILYTLSLSIRLRKMGITLPLARNCVAVALVLISASAAGLSSEGNGVTLIPGASNISRASKHPSQQTRK